MKTRLGGWWLSLSEAPAESDIMQLSVIIPALNEAASITTAVERAWQIGAYEVIVVDGGSQDGTQELARAAGADVVTTSQGRGIQQNYGARQATGDVLLFQHADNWLEPVAGQQIGAALQNAEVAGGAFRQCIEAEGAKYRLLEWANAQRVLRLRMAYGDQGIFLRRHLFEKVGGFPDVPLMEDVLLMRKLRKRARLVLLPGPLHVSARRWQQHGVFRQTLHNWSLLAAHRLGVSEERLSRRYEKTGKGSVKLKM